MIPELRLSAQPVEAEFLSADELPRQRLQDFEDGGIAIGDPSQGLRVQTWELSVLGRDVRVRPFPSGTPTVLFQDSDISRVGLAWDQNMRPAVVYVKQGVTKLWWFNPEPTEQRQVFTVIPGARDPVLCLDDKRPGQRDFSDILLFYLKDPLDEPSQRLFMRAQRDRYGVEYAIGSLPTGTTTLIQAGMNKAGRLQFRLAGRYPRPGDGLPTYPPYPPDVPTQGLVLQFGGQGYGGSVGSGELQFEFEYYSPPESDLL
jgi:hypothetical protein